MSHTQILKDEEKGLASGLLERCFVTGDVIEWFNLNYDKEFKRYYRKDKVREYVKLRKN
jgi:hypothetical protein